MAGFRLAPKAARARRNPWQRPRVVSGFGVTAAYLSGSSTVTFSGDGVLAASLVGSCTLTFTGSGSLNPVLFGSSTLTFTTSGSLGPQINGSSSVTFSTSGTLTLGQPSLVQGGLYLLFAPTIAPAIPAALAGQSILTFDASGTLVPLLSGSSTLTFTTSTLTFIAGETTPTYWWRKRSNMATAKEYKRLIEAGTNRSTAYRSSTLEADTEAGLMVFLNVESASGTGGLTVRINAHDYASSQAIPLNTAPTAVTATGSYIYALYPLALSGAVTQSTAGYLPRAFSVSVSVGDASSYTYSLGYCLLP